MTPAKYILSVVGARPQFVKAAFVSRALAAASITERLVHTGQHYDFEMSERFFAELGVPEPFVNLGVGSGSHGAQTGEMLIRLERLMMEERPPAVLVYGDTNSTLAAALAAAKLNIPLIHVEAGLRSGNMRMPEEVNRVVTDRLSSLLFAPTDGAVRNLVAESLSAAAIRMVGDVMYDAALWSRTLTHDSSKGEHYALVTIHRAENTGDVTRLRNIFGALKILAREMKVLLPLHPRTRAALVEAGVQPDQTLTILPPVGYLEMMALEANAEVVITDSGGVQKEAYFHRVPCVTLRDETEWTELVAAGWNRLAPATSIDSMVMAVRSARSQQRSDWVELYGDGQTAVRIASGIQSLLDSLR